MVMIKHVHKYITLVVTTKKSSSVIQNGIVTYSLMEIV